MVTPPLPCHVFRTRWGWTGRRCGIVDPTGRRCDTCPAAGFGGERRRFGYRRLGSLLSREGIVLNHKKLRRLYAEERLHVRRRGGVPAGLQPRPAALGAGWPGTRLAQRADVLACVKAAACRLRRWPPASLDPGCARRLGSVWPGRRNGARPNRETPTRWAWRQPRTLLLNGEKKGVGALPASPSRNEFFLQPQASRPSAGDRVCRTGARQGRLSGALTVQ